jgi:hypothetical protein
MTATAVCVHTERYIASCIDYVYELGAIDYAQWICPRCKNFVIPDSVSEVWEREAAEVSDQNGV